MNNVIITQAKDQSKRLKDWVLYHKEEGFDTIFYFDDFSEDDSIEVMQKLSEKYDINIIINKTDGHGSTRNSTEMKSSDSYAGDLSVNYRIIRSFNIGLNLVKEVNPDALCAFIDVDEFLVSNTEKISDVVKDLISNREQLYVHSFDIDDRFNLDDWYTTDKISSYRWDYDSRKNTIYKERGKSLCYANTLSEIEQGPNYVHVLKPKFNSISPLYVPGLINNISIEDYNTLRIHHFRKPAQNVEIEFSEDRTLLDKMLKLKEKYDV
jgi:hypothetical protein